MNVNKIFEEKWEQIRAQTKDWWSLFTEDDLKKVEKAPIKSDKYAMMLRMKYGYSHERAREEINKRLDGLGVNPQTIESMGDSPVPPKGPTVSTFRNRRTKKSKSLSENNIETE